MTMCFNYFSNNKNWHRFRS